MQKYLTLAALALILFCPVAKAQSAPPVPAVNEAVVIWDPDPAADPVTQAFTIERKAQACTGTAAFAEIAAPAAPAQWYLDTNLTRGTTYCYRAFRVGVGLAGKSAASNTAQKTIPSVPAAPVIRVQ